MRLIAKFQMTVPSNDDDVADRIRRVLDRWRAGKFERSEDGGTRIRRGGKDAALDAVSDRVGDLRRDGLVVLEPVEGGSLQTDVDVFSGLGRTAFRCVLSVGSDAGVAPPELSVRAPRFVREIVDLGVAWTIGVSGERVFGRSFAVEADEVPELESLMAAPERRLPIVIVSELLGETLAGDLHERLGHDLCGLAHTVRLSHEASWELTRRLGREWSCYNGAVRLLWPFGSGRNDPRAHPLWTVDQLLQRADDAPRARDRIRGVIAARVLEASTFVADDPAFRDFEGAKLAHAAERARAAAADGGDMGKLADLFADENALLRERVGLQDKEIQTLRENVEALTVAARSSGPDIAEAAEPAPPQTVEDAVATARQELAGRLLIAPETQADLAGLNPAAGPEKILRYLRTLADLSDALAAGPLGRSVPIWLRDRNVDCSGDSETAKGSKEGRRFRTRTIDGESVECPFHAKPFDGTSPDMCARIYFAVLPTEPRVRVGYIGRHVA